MLYAAGLRQGGLGEQPLEEAVALERRRRGALALLCKARVVAEHAPAASNRDPGPPQRTSRTVPSIAAQVTRPSQTPAHAAIQARANAVPIAASHPARAAEVCSDASRRLAPRSLARRAARVGAPVPQAGPVAAQDPARIEPHGGARPVLLHTPAARKRSASAAAGASVPLSPSAPLRARSGSCSAGDEKNDTNNHPCTSTSAFAHSSENMLITSRRFAQSVAPCSKASHAEKNVPRAQC